MLRDKWKFEYTASKLAEAATEKKSHHEARSRWWEGKKAEVMDKVRDSGIEIHDSVATSYSNTSGNYGPQITIDATLQRDLSECQQKIQEHDKLTREYDGWIQVLSAHSESRVELDHQDYLFFFSK